MMKLCWSKTSPFVRKVEILLKYHKLWDQTEAIETLVWDKNSAHEDLLPLGKIPALEIKPDYWLYDSNLICQYVDSIGSNAKLYPVNEVRWDSLRLETLAGSIIDNGVLMIIELNNRADKNFWHERHHTLVKRNAKSLKFIESNFNEFKDRFDISTIAIVCMIDWLNLRGPNFNLDPKEHAPKTVKWVQEINAKYPFIGETKPS